MKKLILDKDQEILFNKIPKPNLLEIVEDDDDQNKNEARKSLGEELSDRKSAGSGGNPFDKASLEITERIKKQNQRRESNPELEEQQIQDIYDRLNRNRTSSTINERLLEALEEFVVRQRTEREAESHREIREEKDPNNENETL